MYINGKLVSNVYIQFGIEKNQPNITLSVTEYSNGDRYLLDLHSLWYRLVPQDIRVPRLDMNRTCTTCALGHVH